MSFAHMCAILVVEPYNLSLEEIAELTDDQLVDIYFRPRDKDGSPLSDSEIGVDEEGQRGPPADTGGHSGYKGIFWATWKDARELEEEQVQALWREYLRKNPETAKDYPKDLADG